MNSHSNFSDSDDEVTGSYHYSDPDHCDKGDECDGEHTYSCEYFRSGGGRSELSEDKSETVDGKPQSLSQRVVIDDCEGDDKSGDADPVEFADNSTDDNSDSGDDDHNSDSEDAQSCS